MEPFGLAKRNGEGVDYLLIPGNRIPSVETILDESSLFIELLTKLAKHIAGRQSNITNTGTEVYRAGKLREITQILQ